MEDPNLLQMNSANSPLNGEYDILRPHQTIREPTERRNRHKNMIRKCDKEGTDQFEAFMEQSNTPRQDTDLSPCEMMFERPTRKRLPKLIHSEMGRNPKRGERKKSVKLYYNKTTYNKPTLKQNQNVFFKRKTNEKLVLGKNCRLSS